MKNMIYVVTDKFDSIAGHTTMSSPEEFINWIEEGIIYYNKLDGQIMDAANRLIEVLNRQIAGEAMHQFVVNAANELGLCVTVIAGTVLADWE